MGCLMANRAVNALINGGIRAASAWPGQKMPHITSPVAAVCLESADYQKRETTILVTIYSPEEGGGDLCEVAAMEARDVLQAQGAYCKVEGCRYDGQLHLFSMELHALYIDHESLEEAEKLPATVRLGSAPLEFLSGFKSWHLSDDPKTVPLSASVCYFRIEEKIPFGESEQNTPAEPFTITVKRGGTVETFTGCYLTSDVREDQVDGVNRVRSGTAEKKNYSSIL